MPSLPASAFGARVVVPDPRGPGEPAGRELAAAVAQVLRERLPVGAPLAAPLVLHIPGLRLTLAGGSPAEPLAQSIALAILRSLGR